MLRDDLGRRFDSSALSVGALANSAGIFLLQRGDTNNTFVVKALNEGQAIVKFWFHGTALKSVTVSETAVPSWSDTAVPPVVSAPNAAEVYEAHTHLADYVRLQAVHPILPDGSVSLHVGGAVQLQSASSISRWSSSDESVVSVDASTGHVKANRVGEANIYHHGIQTSSKRAL